MFLFLKSCIYGLWIDFCGMKPPVGVVTFPPSNDVMKRGCCCYVFPVLNMNDEIWSIWRWTGFKLNCCLKQMSFIDFALIVHIVGVFGGGVWRREDGHLATSFVFVAALMMRQAPSLWTFASVMSFLLSGPHQHIWQLNKLNPSR